MMWQIEVSTINGKPTGGGDLGEGYLRPGKAYKTRVKDTQSGTRNGEAKHATMLQSSGMGYGFAGSHSQSHTRIGIGWKALYEVGYKSIKIASCFGMHPRPDSFTGDL